MIGALYKKLCTDICDYGGKGVNSKNSFVHFEATKL